MIDDLAGRIDYEETGTGPTLVLVPGSCSTGAAWRPVMSAWQDRYRCVTTSLLGYGRTAERRTTGDTSIVHEAEIIETVVRRAGGRVHLVGHSFGGLVALAVALRKRVSLASLTILEAPALELLHAMGEAQHYRSFLSMTDAYFSAFARGDAEAVAIMIDFYGGAGTYASWPPRLRAYAAETAHVNIVDWASAFGYPLTPETLAGLALPALVVTGSASHPAARHANVLLSACLRGAALVTLEGAAHFMIATHAAEVARAISRHVSGAEAGP